MNAAVFRFFLFTLIGIILFTLSDSSLDAVNLLQHQHPGRFPHLVALLSSLCVLSFLKACLTAMYDHTVHI